LEAFQEWQEGHHKVDPPMEMLCIQMASLELVLELDKTISRVVVHLNKLVVSFQES